MKNCRYNIFRTRWGWFGLLASEHRIMRTCLPMAHKGAVQSRLLLGVPNAKRPKTAFSVLETRIQAYYEGNSDSFQDVDVYLDGLSD